MHVDLAQRVLERRLRAVVGVQALVAELRVGDRGGGGHQVARIHLAGAGEDDPVLVHHHHGAVGLDRALDLAGLERRTHHPVQHRVVRALLELHGRVAADVEGVPVQDCPRLRLFNGDDLAAVLDAGLGSLGAFPFGLLARRGPQPAFNQPVRHVATVGGCRGGARRRLGGLLRRDGGSRSVQVFQRPLQLLARLRLLARAAADAGQAAVGHAARTLRRRLHRVLVGEPARAERPLLRLRRPAGAARDQQRRHGLGQWRRTPIRAHSCRHGPHVSLATQPRHPCLHDRHPLFQSRVFVT
ncbi:hypothetical protein D3C86_920430 [compost metagenome]